VHCKQLCRCVPVNRKGAFDCDSRSPRFDRSRSTGSLWRCDQSPFVLGSVSDVMSVVRAEVAATATSGPPALKSRQLGFGDPTLAIA
jgi:hypothetical protein